MSEWAEQRSIPVPESGCWLWLGCTDGKGYGMATLRRISTRAHRLAWEEDFGAIPKGLQVLHKCDTPRCVNTAHLFLGTNADNVADKMAKGREAKGRVIGDKMRGERQGSSKLTESMAIQIKASSERGVVLSKKYGVCQSVISQIKSGKLWRHI